MMNTSILMAVWVVLSTGCAATTSFVSAKDPNFHGMLTELFVVSQVGSEGEISGDLFKTELERTAQGCGIRVGVTNMSKLELDPGIHLRRFKSFGSKYLLTLAATGGTKNDGTIVVSTYDARLYDASDQIVWRADVRLSLGGTIREDRGSTELARGLLIKLNTDGVTRWCASLVEPVTESDRGQPRR